MQRMLLINHLSLKLLAPLFGAIGALAFAPFNYSFTIFLSILALLFFIDGKSPKQAAGYAFLWSLGFFIGGIHWVSVSILDFGGMPVVIALLLVVMLCAYLALYPTLCAYLLNKIAPQTSELRYIVLFPALWLLTDWLRGWMLTGFPWLQLGYSQMDNPLVNFAPVLGVESVTFAVTLLCGAVFYGFKQRSLLITNVTIAVVLLGAFALENIEWTTPQPSKKIALVQGNTDQNEKWLLSKRNDILDNYLNLSLQNTDADIIIWPESAIPALEFQVEDFLEYTKEKMAATNTALITGVINFQRTPARDEYYNAVIVLGDENGIPESTNRYYKNKLLPIGEFVPFEDILRPIAPLFNLPMSSFQRGGETQHNLAASGTNIATAICYEIAFNQSLVHTVNEETDYILTVSNDAWFGSSIGPDQHLQIARMRAFEFQRPVIRNTNTGLTAIFDQKGQEIAKIAQFETDVLRATVTPYRGMTPFNQFGNTPILVLAFLLLGFALIRTKLTKK